MEAAEDLLRKIVLDLRKALEMQVTVQEDALLKAAQKKFVGKTTDEHLRYAAKIVPLLFGCPCVA